MNRRGFLKKSLQGLGGAALLGDPLRIMLGNILSSVFQRAYALDQGETGFLDKKLISLSLTGGPSRWFFDLPLRPNGIDVFQYNTANDPKTSMLITRLNPGSDGISGYIGEYATTAIGDYQFPYLWAGKIATVDGGVENMSKLAQNMLIMRGIRSVDSHAMGRTLQSKPSSGISLGGAVADRATTVLPALSMGMLPGTFKSAKGIVSQEMPVTDPFTTAFLPFNSASSLISNSANYSVAIDHALNVMKAKAGSRHKMVPFTFEDRINARRLMTTQFTNLAGAYTDLRQKYATLISRSLSEAALRLNGVDNVSLQGSSVGAFSLSLPIQSSFYTGSDLSSITDAQSSVGRLAETMAVAEFMLCGGGYGQSFSSTLHAEIGNLNNCILDSYLENGVQKLNQRVGLIPDAHFTGSFVQLVQFSRYYRAIASCLYELISRLKATPSGSSNLFDRSVISIHSEFNRSARDAGTGADHGPNGSCYTVFSGMVEKTLVVGDIRKDGGYNNYRGTWGTGAPMIEFSNQQAVVGNAASTVALMLGIKTPTPNNAPFVNFNPVTGKVTPVVGAPKNVA